MHRSLFPAVFLLLTACGGGGGSSDGSGAARGATDTPTPVDPAPDLSKAYANTDAAMNVCRTARQEFVASGTDDEATYIATLETIAEKSEPCAMYGLGLLYVTGFERAGVTPDTAKAKQWLQKAADKQHLLSIALLDELNKK